MKRRIWKELLLLEKNQFLVENYIYYNNSVKVKLNNKFIIKLVFDEYYPFTRPKVYIIYNDRENEYINFTHLKYTRYIDQLNKENKKCFCNMTIMCKDWKPSYKIIDIINDVLNIQNQIKRIIYSSYTNKICNKYNIPDEIIDLINNFY
jgi:hypothetical protein